MGYQPGRLCNRYGSRYFQECSQHYTDYDRKPDCKTQWRRAIVLRRFIMAKKTGKKTGKLDLFPIINGIIMVLFIVITLYPVLNTLAISLNDGTDALRGGIYLLPRKFTWKNYITVLQKDNLITGAYITVARTIIGTLLALVANAILAFIVSRKRFLFKKELSLFWVIPNSG